MVWKLEIVINLKSFFKCVVLSRCRSTRRAGIVVFLTLIMSAESFAQSDECAASNSTTVIWCESFESNEPLASRYFDFNSDEDDLEIVSTISMHGQRALRATWDAGEVDAGAFMVSFGKSPVDSQSSANESYREIYWRLYLLLEDGFDGQPDKLTRATVFANANWAQAMIAHLWTSGGTVLELDPATGIDEFGNLATTKWNDFGNLRFLGAKRGVTTFQPGRWYCVEAHVRLNDPGLENGVFEFWIDDNLQAASESLNWVGTWNEYAINAINFSGYWGAGSPARQSRYLDGIVIATEKIGCGTSSISRPKAPSDFRTE